MYIMYIYIYIHKYINIYKYYRIYLYIYLYIERERYTHIHIYIYIYGGPWLCARGRVLAHGGPPGGFCCFMCYINVLLSCFTWFSVLLFACCCSLCHFV